MLYAIVAFVAGTLFLMWLGEQITDKGIGNGVSLIIFVGIVLRYPQYVAQTFTLGEQRGRQCCSAWCCMSRSRSSRSSRSSSCTRASAASRSSKPAGWSAARCSPGARPTFRCGSTTPASSRSSSRSRSCCCRSRRCRGSAPAIARQRLRRRSDEQSELPGVAQRLVHAQLVPLQHRLFLAGRGLHVLLQLDRRQHARHRGQSQEDGLVHPRHPAWAADGGLHQQDLLRITTAAAVYLGMLAVLPIAAARTRRDHVLYRLDLAADRGRRRARHDHADRSAPGDARLPRVHQG